MKRGNGEGSVFKLSGKRRNPWAVRITVGWNEDGKQILKYLGYYRTKTDAKKALNEYIRNPYELDNKKITLKEVYDRWLETTNLSEMTLRSYKSGFNRFAPLHSQPIMKLKAMHFEEILVNVTTSGQHTAKNALGRVYEYALKNDIVSKNIVPLIQTERHTATREKIPFTKDQIRTLLEFTDHHYADTLNILLYTGLRITELFDIETANIHLDQRYMVGGKKTKAGTNRIIPIHDEIYEIIKAKYNPDNKYLITSLRGRKVQYQNYLTTFCNPLKEELGMKQTPHDTRHAFITQADENEVDRISLQRIVGHNDADTTEHYTARTMDKLLNEINKIQY